MFMISIKVNFNHFVAQILQFKSNVQRTDNLFIKIFLWGQLQKIPISLLNGT